MQRTFWAPPSWATVSATWTEPALSFQDYHCSYQTFGIDFTFQTTTDSLSKLKSANPTSKEDWEALSDSIFTELIKKQSSKPGFEKHFAPHLFKLIASTMRDVDIRKSSTMLKTYAEDKAKAEKEAKKSGGQKKTAAAKPKTVGTASAKNVIDTRACKCPFQSAKNPTDYFKQLTNIDPLNPRSPHIQTATRPSMTTLTLCKTPHRPETPSPSSCRSLSKQSTRLQSNLLSHSELIDY